MSDLRDAALRIAEMSRFPLPRADRKLAVERIAEKLAHRPSGVLRNDEPWEDFLKRIGVI